MTLTQFILGFGMVMGAWSVLRLMGDERQRRVIEIEAARASAAATAAATAASAAGKISTATSPTPQGGFRPAAGKTKH